MNPDVKSNVSPEPASRYHGSRVYVWIVTASTMLLLTAMLWPMSVNHFQSTAYFQLRYDPSYGLEKSTVNQLVIDAVRAQTESEPLATLISDLELELASPLLQGPDDEKLRNALRVQNRPGKLANSIDFRISLVGSGTPDEVEFVNALASRVTSNIGTTTLSKTAGQAIDELTADFESMQTKQVVQYQENVRHILSGITSAHNELQTIIDNLNRLSPSTQRTAEQNSATQPLDQLVARRDELVREKQRRMQADGIVEIHPSLHSLRLQIESLNQEIMARQGEPSANSSNEFIGRRIKNQFATDQQVTPIDGGFISQSLKDLSSELQMLDLSGPRNRLNEVQTTLANQNQGSRLIIDRMNHRAQAKIAALSPVSFNQITLARRSQPIGGVPSMNNFLLISLFAGIAATVVAMKFDPALRTRRFRSIVQLEHKLGIPVVGTLRSRRHRGEPKALSARVSIIVVRCCEWALLALLILLIIAALVNSELVGAFLENPFHAAAKTFWMVAPK